MNRKTKRLLLLMSLIAVAAVTSGCEIDVFPLVDCSGINQPDMGGLVCVGLNFFALSASVVALIIALLLALPR